jgi:hypothetical protein
LGKYNLQAAEKNQKIQKEIKSQRVNFANNSKTKTMTNEQYITNQILLNQNLSVILHLLELLKQVCKNKSAKITNRKNNNESKQKMKDKIENRNDKFYFIKSHYKLSYWKAEENFLRVENEDINFFKKIEEFIYKSFKINRIYDKNFWTSKNTKKNYEIFVAPKPNFPLFSSFLLISNNFDTQTNAEIIGNTNNNRKRVIKISEKENKKTKISFTKKGLGKKILLLFLFSINFLFEKKENIGGYTCYANSIIQCLFSIFEFTSKLSNTRSFNKTLLESYELYNDQTSGMTLSLKNFYEIFTKKEYEENKFQDTHDFYLKLINKLVEEEENFKDDTFKNLFGITSERNIVCENCNAIEVQEESNYSLSIKAPDIKTTISQIIEEQQTKKFISQECKKCKKNSISLTQKIEKFPTILVVHVDRTSKHQEIDFSNSLKFTNFENILTYKLIAISSHEGTKFHGLILFFKFIFNLFSLYFFVL